VNIKGNKHIVYFLRDSFEIQNIGNWSKNCHGSHCFLLAAPSNYF